MSGIHYSDEHGTLYLGDAKIVLEDLVEENIADMCITSPPYWALRNYHEEGQLGQEPTIAEYIDKLCDYIDPVWAILKNEGTLWVNIGDTYYSGNKGSGGKSKKQTSNEGSFFEPIKIAGKELPEKSLCMIPSRFAIAMQKRGWILRNDIIWRKPNVMVTSAKDRFTADYEHIFLFSKIGKGYLFNQQVEPMTESSKKRYKYGWNGKTEQEVSWKGLSATYGSEEKREQAIARGTRNKRTVWDISTKGKRGGIHFAKFPEKLIETPILAGSNPGGVILDIFMGSGTTAVVAERLGRKWIGIELNTNYADSAVERILESRQTVTPGVCSFGYPMNV